jgi:hypothetical protein
LLVTNTVAYFASSTVTKENGFITLTLGFCDSSKYTYENSECLAENYHMDSKKLQSIVLLSVVILSVIVLCIIMLSVIILRVLILGVTVLCIIMLSVVMLSASC